MDGCLDIQVGTKKNNQAADDCLTTYYFISRYECLPVFTTVYPAVYEKGLSPYDL